MNENSREYNEISDLLDSIESDDTLERKMDAFKAKKSRKDRLKRKRAEEQALEKEAQETISIEPIKTVPETSETAGHTVAMPKLSSELLDKSQRMRLLRPKRSTCMPIKRKQEIRLVDKRLYSILHK